MDKYTKLGVFDCISGLWIFSVIISISALKVNMESMGIDSSVASSGR